MSRRTWSRSPSSRSAWSWPLLAVCRAAASAVRAAGAGARPTTFNDSHFHLTNYIQEGIDVQRLPADHGDARRPLDAVRHPAAAAVVVRRTPATSRRPTTCRPTRRSTTTRSPTPTSPCVYRSLTTEQQARFDPMITGFNPADMYAADHIRRVLKTFPGVFTGHRRVQHPQGVRLAEDRRRDGQPHQPGARSHPRLRRRGRARRDPSQRHRHAVCRSRTPEPSISRRLKALLQAPPEDHDHLGPLSAWAASSIRSRSRPSGGTRPRSEIVERCSTTRRCATSPSTSRGTRSRSTSWPRRRRSPRVAELINRYPDRFLFGTDDGRARRSRRRTSRSSTCRRRLARSSRPRPASKVRKGNYERLFDEARRSVRAWEAARA